MDATQCKPESLLRVRATLRLRYGLDGKEPLSLEGVGRVFKVTRERVRQIENRAIRKLQQSDRAKIITGDE